MKEWVCGAMLVKAGAGMGEMTVIAIGDKEHCEIAAESLRAKHVLLDAVRHSKGKLLYAKILVQEIEYCDG